MPTRITFEEMKELVHQFETQPRHQLYKIVDCKLVPIDDDLPRPADYALMLHLSPEVLEWSTINIGY
jgi:hypothetical protein